MFVLFNEIIRINFGPVRVVVDVDFVVVDFDVMGIVIPHAMFHFDALFLVRSVSLSVIPCAERCTDPIDSIAGA